MIVLRALGALLSYPRDEVRQALPEIVDAISGSQFIPPRQRRDLLALIDELRAGDLLEVEERYVELFDRGRAASLHLFEHLHGEDRDRDIRETREILGDCAHILRRIGESLIARRSGYAAVLQALLIIAGEDPIDAAAVPRVKERTENLDRDWFEQPAFGGEPSGSAGSPARPAPSPPVVPTPR
jgi:nitrate reductase delta subunit